MEEQPSARNPTKCEEEKRQMLDNSLTNLLFVYFKWVLIDLLARHLIQLSSML